MLDRYDAVVVGTGFASSFFLKAYLEKAGPKVRVLVLERGRRDGHAWQVQNRRNSSTPSEGTFVNTSEGKKWRFNIGFGGGSNCWWACTPRMLPSDFELRTRYGVGVDWPLSYDELEEYYCQAELVMGVSGPQGASPFPRSRPYPQPPHQLSGPDKLLQKAFPDRFFVQPTARARQPTGKRSLCCATGVCDLCPVDAKFRVDNELAYIYADQRVELVLGAEVRQVETAGGVAVGVAYLHEGQSVQAKGELVVLGANALFNPFILQQSGLEHPYLGKYLGEQVSKSVLVYLDGVDNFDGSTSITGHGYMHYDGAHRAKRAACLIESFNSLPTLFGRMPLERGKWRQLMLLKFIFEDLPAERNYVKVSDGNPALPEAVFTGHSVYASRSVKVLPRLLDRVLAPLPVERVSIYDRVADTEAHIMGTVTMGTDPKKSVVDRYLIHHQVRNLLVLGTSAFPTAAPANPTLTLAALSLWSADYLLS